MPPYPIKLLAFFSRQRTLHLNLEVGKDVHVVDKGIVGRVVGVEVGVYIPIREPLGSHVVEVIRSLHEVPDVVEIGIFQLGHLLLQAVERLEVRCRAKR